MPPDVLPDVDAIPDQPQEMYFIKRCLRALQDRLAVLEQARAQPTTEAELRKTIADLTARVGVLEREPDPVIPAAVELPAEGCRIYNSANISINHDVETILTFNTEREDTDGMHDPGSPSRITCVTPGVYELGASVQINNTLGSGIWAWGAIRLNGTTYVVEYAATNNGFNARVNPSTRYRLVAGDYVELKVRYNNAAVTASEFVLAVPNTSPEFWAQRLAD